MPIFWMWKLRFRTVKSVQSTQRGDSGIYPWTQVVLLRPQCSVMSNSATHGLWPTRLLCPWDLQARILEWVAISSSRGSSWLRDPTCVSCIGSQVPCHWAISIGIFYILADCFIMLLNFIFLHFWVWPLLCTYLLEFLRLLMVLSLHWFLLQLLLLLSCFSRVRLCATP